MPGRINSRNEENISRPASFDGFAKKFKKRKVRTDRIVFDRDHDDGEIQGGKILLITKILVDRHQCMEACCVDQLKEIAILDPAPANLRDGFDKMTGESLFRPGMHTFV